MNEQIPVYELSVNVQVNWQAHSLSNEGSNGSNRVLPRRQLLADGTVTDACSGNIGKRYHAVLLAEQMAAQNIYLCAACAVGDGRRASALPNIDPAMSTILACGLCDTHGFLITGKKERQADGEGTSMRLRLSKSSLVEFSFALALPGQSAESPQLFTRQATRSEDQSDNDDSGQMIYKKLVRSGAYGQCIRYKAAGVGIDTEIWKPVITEESERLRRHQAILRTLRDQLQSPSGAMTATLLPHLSGIKGVVAVRTEAGRAPLYSPLAADFITQLEQLASPSCLIFSFHSPAEFQAVFERLLRDSYPILPAPRTLSLAR
jgi:CRISPR-associated autoregulator DevR family